MEVAFKILKILLIKNEGTAKQLVLDYTNRNLTDVKWNKIMLPPKAEKFAG